MDHINRDEVITYNDLYFSDMDNAIDMRAKVKGLPWFFCKEFVEAMDLQAAHINIGRPVRNLFLKRNLCPVCKSREYSNNGVNSRGIPRRKCKKCGKSYIGEARITTGDNVLKSRKPSEVWIKFTKKMLEGECNATGKGWVKKASEECDLNIKTSYEWKNRISGGLVELRGYVNSTRNPYYEADLKKKPDSDEALNKTDRTNSEKTFEEQWLQKFYEAYRQLKNDPIKGEERDWFILNTFYSIFIAYSIKEEEQK